MYSRGGQHEPWPCNLNQKNKFQQIYSDTLLAKDLMFIVGVIGVWHYFDVLNPSKIDTFIKMFANLQINKYIK